jgi:hypothetical protein
MANLERTEVITSGELIVSSLTTADTLAKLLIERGLITEAEFMEKLSVERAVYSADVAKNESPLSLRVVGVNPLLRPKSHNSD